MPREEKLFAQDLKVGLQKEVGQLEEDGIANIMESKGLGDSIEKFTKATGIKKLADKIPGGCGCNKRKEKLNEIFPYKK
jgi:hypothetical protein